MVQRSYSAFLLYVMEVSASSLEYAISCSEWLTSVPPVEVLGPAFICLELFILHSFHFFIRKHPTAWHSGTASWNSQRTFQQTRLDANFIHVKWNLTRGFSLGLKVSDEWVIFLIHIYYKIITFFIQLSPRHYSPVQRRSSHFPSFLVFSFTFGVPVWTEVRSCTTLLLM